MADKFVNTLTSVPGIIGELGLSIGAAQKLFNRDYLKNVLRLIALAKSILGGQKKAAGGTADLSAEEAKNLANFGAVLKELLTAVAPPRYQFTETTLAVRLDLAQSIDAALTAGIGVGYSAVTVNAAFSIGYGYDYRAAAECRTVLHAIPADKTVLAPLLARAKELSSKALEMPAGSGVDDDIIQLTRDAHKTLVGAEPPEVESKA